MGILPKREWLFDGVRGCQIVTPQPLRLACKMSRPCAILIALLQLSTLQLVECWGAKRNSSKPPLASVCHEDSCRADAATERPWSWRITKLDDIGRRWMSKSKGETPAYEGCLDPKDQKVIS